MDVVTLLRVVVLRKTCLAVVVSALEAKEEEGSTCSGFFKDRLEKMAGISGCCRSIFESVPNVFKWEMPQGDARRCNGHGEEHLAWARGSLRATEAQCRGIQHPPAPLPEVSPFIKSGPSS